LCAVARDGGDDAGGVDFSDDVVAGFGEVEIALWVEDDCGGEDERDGGGGDAGGLGVQMGCEGEQEDEGDPVGSARAAMERSGCDALRTRGEDVMVRVEQSLIYLNGANSESYFRLGCGRSH
jgi:hypothetical protein